MNCLISSKPCGPFFVSFCFEVRKRHLLWIKVFFLLWTFKTKEVFDVVIVTGTIYIPQFLFPPKRRQWVTQWEKKLNLWLFLWISPKRTPSVRYKNFCPSYRCPLLEKIFLMMFTLVCINLFQGHLSVL